MADRVAGEGRIPEEALREIANMDFRGPRPYEQVVAYEALASLLPSQLEEPEPDPELVEWFKDAFDPGTDTGRFSQPKEKER